MIYPPAIELMIGEVVAAVSTEITPQLQSEQSNITGVHYQYGSVDEIIETLAQYDNHPEKRFDKFPCIFLVGQPYEDRGTVDGYFSDGVIPQLLIVHRTEPNYKSSQRLERTYTPILEPIYEELLNQLDLYAGFITEGAQGIRHRFIRRLFWGREQLKTPTGNTMPTYLDAIELQNLRLTITEGFCITPINID